MTRMMLSLVAIATWYNPHAFTGDVYCQQGHPDVPWVAVDVEHYLSGAVKCGDLLDVHFKSGDVLGVQALDAGPLGKYCIEDHPSLSIVVDVPKHLWPLPIPTLSARVTKVINISEIVRQIERRLLL